jgi:hypothetical protein
MTIARFLFVLRAGIMRPFRFGNRVRLSASAVWRTDVTRFVLVAAMVAALGVSSVAEAETLGGNSKVAEFRGKICVALGLPPGTPSKLLDIVSKHIDVTGEWSLKFLTGQDLYGDEAKAKSLRYFMAIIVKNGRTIVDTLTYDLKTGQLILSEVENIVLGVTAGIEDSKKMGADSAYEKISESKSAAIFHKKGYLQEVAYSVNNNTNAIVKTYTDTFRETVLTSLRAAGPARALD